MWILYMICKKMSVLRHPGHINFNRGFLWFFHTFVITWRMSFRLLESSNSKVLQILTHSLTHSERSLPPNCLYLSSKLFQCTKLTNWRFLNSFKMIDRLRHNRVFTPADSHISPFYAKKVVRQVLMVHINTLNLSEFCIFKAKRESELWINQLT